MDKVSRPLKNLSLRELVDTAILQKLSDDYSHLTGISTAVIDTEGHILVASNWSRICLDFHRKNNESAKKCQESDTALACQLAEGNAYNVYICKNGLIDVAVPITIEGRHLGNVFTGQFFFERPDYSFFSEQARHYGFDLKQYMAALQEVPVVNEKYMQQVLQFLVDLTVLITKMGLDRQHLLELTNSLEERVKERTGALERSIAIREQAEQEHQKTSLFLESVFNAIQDGISVLDTDLNIVRVNRVMHTLYPQLSHALGEKCFAVYHNRNSPCTTCPTRRALTTNRIEMNEVPYIKDNSEAGTLELYAFPISDKTGKCTGIVEYVRDITERKRIEQNMQREQQFSDALIHSLPGIMYLFDSSRKLKRWNNNFERLFAFHPQQLAAMDFLEFIAVNERQQVQEQINSIFNAGRGDIKTRLCLSDGTTIPYLLTGSKLEREGNHFLVGIGLDISHLVQAEKEKDVLIDSLRDALSQVKQLSGFLPICASCKKIRDDEGYWSQLETYLKQHSDVVFSHGLCPECAELLYPGLTDNEEKE